MYELQIIADLLRPKNSPTGSSLPAMAGAKARLGLKQNPEKKTIDLANWIPGTYLVSLKWDGVIMQTKKFTVN